jgi:hypothetical protein
MNIIQSFAEYETGSPYLKNIDSNTKYLMFYSFFLSYLTLKKYYGYVIMYCNDQAYNTFIKFIPYDKIIYKECKNNVKFWNKYKADIIGEQQDDFIHVDSDVFIFKDLFKPFIDSKKYDVIAQDIIPQDVNFAKHFVPDNKDWLKKNNVFDFNKYDGRCFSCGTIGLRQKYINNYVEKVEKIYNGFIAGKLISEDWIDSMITEELSMYLVALENNLKIHDILPYNEIIKINGNPRSLGVIYGYTHMWFSTKFVKTNVELIKNKIKKDFPTYYHIVEEYDKYISKFNIKYLNYREN